MIAKNKKQQKYRLKTGREGLRIPSRPLYVLQNAGAQSEIIQKRTIKKRPGFSKEQVKYVFRNERKTVAVCVQAGSERSKNKAI